MHELGLARDLFGKILAKAQEERLGKIKKIVLRVGVAAGIDSDLLRHSLEDHIFPGTIAEGAGLTILKDPLRVRCAKCHKDIQDQEQFTLSCPFCGSVDTEIVGGKEILIETLS